MVAACMLAGTTPVITGCVDTDEPAGIEQLRGAKAELLRAQAAVEQALVAVKQADAQYRLAEAALKQADADYKAQQAREQELKNDLQEAKNEYELQKAEADYQAYLEELARRKQYYEKQLEEQLATMEANIMQQKAMYEKYRQELEIAKITGDIDTQTAISKLEGAVDEAFAKLYGGKVGGIEYTGAYMELFYANKALQEAQAYQSQGLDCTIEKKADGTYKVTVASEGKDWVATLQAVKENAEAERDAASKLLADLETYGDKEVEGTDWKAEVEAIEAEIEKLQAELDVQEAQLAQAQATPEYLAALQAVEGVWEDNKGFDFSTADPNLKDIEWRENPAYDSNDPNSIRYQTIVKDGAEQTVERAKQALIEAQKEATFTYPAFEVATEVTDEMVSAINAGVGKLNAEITDPSKQYNSISSGDDFSYDAVEESDKLVWGTGQDEKGNPVPATIEEQPQKIENVISDYEDWIAIVDAATIDPNELGEANALLTRAKEALKSATDAFDGALLNWEEIKDIYTNRKTVQVSTETFELSTAAYNTAYDALNTAISNWNTSIKKAYDDAYNAGIAEWEFELMQEAVLSTDGVNLTSLTAFDKAAFSADWNALNEDEKTEEQFRSLVDENFSGDNAATQQATFWDLVDAWVSLAKVENGEPANIKTDALAAVTEGNSTYFDKDGKLKKAITDAATAINNTVNGTAAAGKPKTLEEAITAFVELANSKGQVLTTASANNLNKDVLITPADNTGKHGTAPSNADGFYTSSNKDGYVTYAIAVNKIEDAEITAATATQYDEAKAEVALREESAAVFGIDETIMLPNADADDDTRTWVEQKYAELVEAGQENANTSIQKADGTYYTVKELYEASYAYNMYEAEDLVEGYQNQIDASAELDDLLKELQDAKAAFEKTINDQYTANFGELETDLATANEDLAEKYEALEVENNKHQDIKVAMAELKAQIDAEEELAKVLREAAWTYLGITWPESGSASTSDSDNDLQYTQPSEYGEYNPEEFAKYLQEAIEYQKLVVADAEKAVAIAEAELQKAQAEGYNGADQASLYVNIATLKYQTAYDKYQKALEDLQRAMDVLAAAE